MSIGFIVGIVITLIVLFLVLSIRSHRRGSCRRGYSGHSGSDSWFFGGCDGGGCD